jgi:ribosomal protein S6
MNKQTNHPCDELLKQWQMKRETANFYFTALLRLSPDASDALRRRQELNEKVIESLLVWKQVDDQLQSCYQEHGQGS